MTAALLEAAAPLRPAIVMAPAAAPAVVATGRVVTMADAIRPNAGSLIASSVQLLGAYVTGTGIAWSLEQIDAATKAGHRVVRIDQTPDLAAFARGDADVADIEPGAGTPAAFAEAVKARTARGQTSTFYGDAVAVEDIANVVQSRATVDVWFADWNLDESSATAKLGTGLEGFRVAAVQWASPSSNPYTRLPGTVLPLRTANCDLSVALEDFADSPVPRAPEPVPVKPVVRLIGWATYIQEGYAANPRDLCSVQVVSTDDGVTWTRV